MRAAGHNWTGESCNTMRHRRRTVMCNTMRRRVRVPAKVWCGIGEDLEIRQI